MGDSKYDGGGNLAKEARNLGMFLCSNSIEFEHVLLHDRKSTILADIPLPDKFFDMLCLDKDYDLKV